MRRTSDLAHRTEGIILCLAALIAVIQSFGVMNRGAATLAWPGLIAFAGAALMIYMVAPHHGMDHAREQWRFVSGDDQQRQHLLIALLGFLGGGVELLHRTGTLSNRWETAWPASLLAVGLVFVLHAQHGEGTAMKRAVILHRLLGSFLIGAGVLRLAEIWMRPGPRWPAISWGLMLFFAGIILIAYREPAGAYEHGTV